MRAFTFRLQRLLDQKLDLESKAKLAVAEKQKTLDEQQAALSRLQEDQKRIERSIHHAREMMLTGPAANAGADIERRNEYLTALEQDFSAARRQTLIQQFAVEEAEAKLSEAQTYALECSRETKKLTRYRERLEERFLEEVQKQEEREQDEIGTTMHLSRKAGA
jgi:flagellar biosynthesis chaperone FliJ